MRLHFHMTARLSCGRKCPCHSSFFEGGDPCASLASWFKCAQRVRQPPKLFPTAPTLKGAQCDVKQAGAQQNTRTASVSEACLICKGQQWSDLRLRRRALWTLKGSAPQRTSSLPSNVTDSVFYQANQQESHAGPFHPFKWSIFLY